MKYDELPSILTGLENLISVALAIINEALLTISLNVFSPDNSNLLLV
jgi:hypothetical protein